MENLTVEELKKLAYWYEWMAQFSHVGPLAGDLVLLEKIKQAIADKEFEEKTRPLNF